MSENKTTLFWILIAIAILMAAFSVLTWWPWGWYMPGMMGMMGFGWGFMFLIPLAFIIIAVLGAYFLLTEFPKTIGCQSSSVRALEILKERYAKGEITREEYLRMKKELE